MTQPGFRPVDRALLFTRNDVYDPRIGEQVRVSPELTSASAIEDVLGELTDPHLVVIGYPDDDGIALNGGRRGAAAAPDRIRKYLYRMTPPAFIPPADKRQKQCIIDIGNLAIDGSSLGARHEAAQAAVHIALKLGHRVLSLGGGHDYGFPDALASAKQAEASGHRPLLINFDAHLDVRPIENGLTSGTPFFRLLEAKPATELIEIGLQAQCNSPFHFEWLKAHGGTACFEEERSASQSSLLDALAAKLGDRALKRRPAFLSVDIDVFSSAVAPGASQSWPTGIRPDEFFPAFQWCLGRFDVPHVGIYEVSPVLDIDDRTSRLAALIAYRFMFQLFS